MNIQDYVGKRGERIFSVLITRWCDGTPWFDDVFLGEKQPTKDFIVNLIEPTSGDACFYVQVKATRRGYVGTGADRKLIVRVSKKDVQKLRKAPGPAFVVGIDIDAERGFIVSINDSTKGGLNGISVRHPLNCHTIKKLWKEVDDYWKGRQMLMKQSSFL